ncbi:hypothetical protein POX_a00863 [Penicillium oxalicum]|uniref:hypothetical protein n=1 Tax=Penicillium oxalicum TaxID=69781 RepID=UPI0020B79B19|nr:hypothetical protein POX_a00863 [Penicillium oxalicum]KAI2794271.1 hypothetical protein POX_a00863 [Penicillium oxalicum]
MSSFAPPPGPPPPTVPEGWKAQYDERYQTWFYIDTATGKSQWERPEGPPAPSGPPSGPPPQDHHQHPSPTISGDHKQAMASNNPYNPANQSNNTLDEDARLAAKLQAEEDSRARSSSAAGDRGTASDYYAGTGAGDSSQGQVPPGYGGAGQGSSQSQSPMPEQKRSKGGFLSKLLGKASGSGSSSSSRPPFGQQYPSQQYGGYPQQGPPQGPGGGHYGGGYPPQQPGYGGYPPQMGYGGGYPPQAGGGYYQQQPPRRGGGGMGTAGAAALGVGGGLLGGMLIADAIDDHDDYGGGGDYGGGDDFGGGDF